MFISLFLMMSLPVLLSAKLSHEVYLDLWSFERHVVDLDNFAILLGRNDRDFFRTLKNWKRRIDKLEGAHHILHACARVPQTRLVCLPKDKLMEATLRATMTLSEADLRRRWTKGNTLILGGQWAVEGRPFKFFLQRRSCSFCGMKTEWAALNRSMTYLIRSQKYPEFKLRLRIREYGGQWNYQVKVLEDEKPVP